MSIKKSLLWFYMFSKRLLFRWSYVILLCSIPLLIWGANIAMQGESGILTIYLCTEDSSGAAEDIINYIQKDKGSLLFKKSNNLDNALKALEQKKADAVWYFEDNFDEKINNYALGKSKKPFVKVYEREDNIPLKLSREKLFGGVYSRLAYFIYEDFIYSEFIDVNKVPGEVIKEYYGKRETSAEIVTMETLGSKSTNANSSYLVMPLRGLLALLIVLCGFASALVFINDKKDGKFDWLTTEKQIIPAFAQCLAGVSLAAAAVFVAIFMSGISAGFLKELVSMVLFVFAVAGFCLNLCMIFNSPSKPGALIPAFLILMLVLSPVFFNLNILNTIKCMLPTYHYLMSLRNTGYLTGFVCYITCLYFAAWVISRLRGKGFLCK